MTIKVTTKSVVIIHRKGILNEKYVKIPTHKNTQGAINDFKNLVLKLTGSLEIIVIVSFVNGVF